MSLSPARVLLPLLLVCAVQAQSSPQSMTLAATTDAAGSLTVALEGFTPSSTQGYLLFDLGPTAPVGQGVMFGLHLDFLEFLQFVVAAGPPAVGNPTRWVRPSPGIFPDAPLFVPPVLPVGLTIDFVGLVTGTASANFQLSNAARVTIGSPGLTVTGVSQLSVPGGGLVTITGAGFGGQGDQFCVALVTPNGEMHGFVPEVVTDTTMTIRAPDFQTAVVGDLMLQRGKGARAWFSPLVPGLNLPDQQLWGWNAPLDPFGVVLEPGFVVAAGFTATPGATPGQATLKGTVGATSIDLLVPVGACFPAARICIAARMFTANRYGADCRHGVEPFRVQPGMTHAQCCEVIRQAIQACFQARGVLDMQVDCLLQPNGDVLIRMHFVPNMAIDVGELKITVKT